MKFINGHDVREYKDLEEKESEHHVLPLGKILEMKLEYIEDWIKTGFEYIKDEKEVLERLEYTGAGDFFKGVLDYVEEIRELIKE